MHCGLHLHIIRLRDGGNASLGLVERPWSTERRGNPPPFIFTQRGEEVLMAEKILSCFIDESGDFGPYDFRSPYYYVAMVLHDQSEDISEKISVMESRAANNGYTNHAIHTGPLIRRENVYINEQMEDRKHLFNVLYFFTVQLPIHYFCAKVNKAECADDIQQTARLSRAITTELQAHLEYWSSFDKIIVYYDNGQTQLTRIITSVFNTLFSNVEMRRVRPVDYKLFQVADLICTLEMLSDKAEHNGFSKSETEFFGSVGRFKKDYYKKIVNMRL